MAGRLKRQIDGEQKVQAAALLIPTPSPAVSRSAFQSAPPSSLHPSVRVHLSRLFSVRLPACPCVCVCECINPVFITFPDTLTLRRPNPDEAYQSYHFGA